MSFPSINLSKETDHQQVEIISIASTSDDESEFNEPIFVNPPRESNEESEAEAYKPKPWHRLSGLESHRIYPTRSTDTRQDSQAFVTIAFQGSIPPWFKKDRCLATFRGPKVRNIMSLWPLEANRSPAGTKARPKSVQDDGNERIFSTKTSSTTPIMINGSDGCQDPMPTLNTSDHRPQKSWSSSRATLTNTGRLINGAEAFEKSIHQLHPEPTRPGSVWVSECPEGIKRRKKSGIPLHIPNANVVDLISQDVLQQHTPVQTPVSQNTMGEKPETMSSISISSTSKSSGSVNIDQTNSKKNMGMFEANLTSPTTKRSRTVDDKRPYANSKKYKAYSVPPPPRKNNLWECQRIDEKSEADYEDFVQSISSEPQAPHARSKLQCPSTSPNTKNKETLDSCESSTNEHPATAILNSKGIEAPSSMQEKRNEEETVPVVDIAGPGIYYQSDKDVELYFLFETGKEPTIWNFEEFTVELLFTEAAKHKFQKTDLIMIQRLRNDFSSCCSCKGTRYAREKSMCCMVIKADTKSDDVGLWVDESAFVCEDEVVKFGISGKFSTPRTNFSRKIKKAP